MSITGTWYNELGSKLEIQADSEGKLSGTYETAVSSGGCAKGVFSLSGMTDTESGGDTLGFAVTWKNDQSSCNSTTAWAGHYAKGREVFTAFWLLVVKSAPADEWASTMVGEDIFTREEPNPQLQAEVGTRKRHPHP